MTLLSSYQLGRHSLANRVVMAPMTRSRAIDNLPNELMVDYYRQRASAGLIVTEGIAPSPDGLGYARIPGLYSDEQVRGFRAITEAVHAGGSRIFAQLMHVGRIAHPANMPAGARVLAPSAIAAKGEMYTDAEGPQPFAAPAEMSLADIAQVRDEFVQAARNAIAAGFDGIELHGANGYLLEQFLHPASNRREDAYGGSEQARARFVVEIAEAVAEAIGSERVGLRISPYNTFNDMAARDDVTDTYVGLLSQLGSLVYVHVVGNPHPRFGETLAAIRAAYPGTLVRNGGFTQDAAEAAIAAGQADLVAFGRPFIANPDLVQRVERGAPLAEPDPATFYTPGPAGYTDYPTLAAQA